MLQVQPSKMNCRKKPTWTTLSIIIYSQVILLGNVQMGVRAEAVVVSGKE